MKSAIISTLDLVRLLGILIIGIALLEILFGIIETRVERQERLYEQGFYINMSDFTDDAPEISRVLDLASKMHKGLNFDSSTVYYMRSPLKIPARKASIKDWTVMWRGKSWERK